MDLGKKLYLERKYRNLTKKSYLRHWIEKAFSLITQKRK